MKKSELRQIIREEISKVLNKNNKIQKWKIYYQTAASGDSQWYTSEGETEKEALDNLEKWDKKENESKWIKLKKYKVSVKKDEDNLKPYEHGTE